MPNFGTHMTASGLVGAAGAVWGTARWGWDPGLAFMAGLAAFAGGLTPDLDSDTSRGARWAGAAVSLAAAGAAVLYLVHRGRPSGEWLLAGLVTLVVFNTLGVACFKSVTRHRGMFHSLPAALAYGAILTAVLAPSGARPALGVGLLGAAGALSHLVLDALFSLSLNPLKMWSRETWPTILAWLAAGVPAVLAWRGLT